MSHIHIPDGVLPWWLITAGWVLTLIILFMSSHRLRKQEARRKLPLLGVMAAMMLIGMSTEFVPIGYHANLTVLTGIIVGPATGFLAAFIVDLMLAMFGHGGITVVGLNTLIIGTECALGSLIFHTLRKAWRDHRRSVALSAAISVIITLLISTSMLVGLIGISNLDPGKARNTGALNLSTFTFHGLFSEGVVSNRVVNPEKEPMGSLYLHDSGVNLRRFTAAIFLLGSIGWVLEAVITAVIVQFIYRVRRELIL